ARGRNHVFTIDHALAKALRDEERRLTELYRKEAGKRVSATERKKKNLVRTRFAERESANPCPEGYGPIEAHKDRNRLYVLDCKRMSAPSSGGGQLTAREDAEEAQLTARIAAFDESPEGRARSRISELVCDRFKGLSLAEQKELDNLQARYPELP